MLISHSNITQIINKKTIINHTVEQDNLAAQLKELEKQKKLFEKV